MSGTKSSTTRGSPGSGQQPPSPLDQHSTSLSSPPPLADGAASGDPREVTPHPPPPTSPTHFVELPSPLSPTNGGLESLACHGFISSKGHGSSSDVGAAAENRRGHHAALERPAPPQGGPEANGGATPLVAPEPTLYGSSGIFATGETRTPIFPAAGSTPCGHHTHFPTGAALYTPVYVTVGPTSPATVTSTTAAQAAAASIRPGVAASGGAEAGRPRARHKQRNPPAALTAGAQPWHWTGASTVTAAFQQQQQLQVQQQGRRQRRRDIGDGKMAHDGVDDHRRCRDTPMPLYANVAVTAVLAAGANKSGRSSVAPGGSCATRCSPSPQQQQRRTPTSSTPPSTAARWFPAASSTSLGHPESATGSDSKTTSTGRGGRGGVGRGASTDLLSCDDAGLLSVQRSPPSSSSPPQLLLVGSRTPSAETPTPGEATQLVTPTTEFERALFTSVEGTTARMSASLSDAAPEVAGTAAHACHLQEQQHDAFALPTASHSHYGTSTIPGGGPPPPRTSCAGAATASFATKARPKEEEPTPPPPAAAAAQHLGTPDIQRFGHRDGDSLSGRWQSVVEEDNSVYSLAHSQQSSGEHTSSETPMDASEAPVSSLQLRSFDHDHYHPRDDGKATSPAAVASPTTTTTRVHQEADHLPESASPADGRDIAPAGGTTSKSGASGTVHRGTSAVAAEGAAGALGKAARGWHEAPAAAATDTVVVGDSPSTLHAAFLARYSTAPSWVGGSSEELSTGLHGETISSPVAQPRVTNASGFSMTSIHERRTTTLLNSLFTHPDGSAIGEVGPGSLPRKSLTSPTGLTTLRDPLAASLLVRQNRSALIAELKRRRQRLQKQLCALQKEATARNIFAIVRASNAAQLQWLLREGLCNVNDRDYNGCTPLHVAAGEGNQAIVRVLLSFGADVLAVDHNGRTPLDCAAANRHSGMGRYLLSVIRSRLHSEDAVGVAGLHSDDATAVNHRSDRDAGNTADEGSVATGTAQSPSRSPWIFATSPSAFPSSAAVHLSPSSANRQDGSTVAPWHVGFPSSQTSSPNAPVSQAPSLARTPALTLPLSVQQQEESAAVAAGGAAATTTTMTFSASRHPEYLPTIHRGGSEEDSPVAASARLSSSGYSPRTHGSSRVDSAATAPSSATATPSWRHRNTLPHGSSPERPVLLSPLDATAAAHSCDVIAAEGKVHSHGGRGPAVTATAPLAQRTSAPHLGDSRSPADSWANSGRAFGQALPERPIIMVPHYLAGGLEESTSEDAIRVSGPHSLSTTATTSDLRHHRADAKKEEGTDDEEEPLTARDVQCIEDVLLGRHGHIRTSAPHPSPTQAACTGASSVDWLRCGSPCLPKTNSTTTATADASPQEPPSNPPSTALAKSGSADGPPKRMLQPLRHLATVDARERKREDGGEEESATTSIANTPAYSSTTGWGSPGSLAAAAAAPEATKTAAAAWPQSAASGGDSFRAGASASSMSLLPSGSHCDIGQQSIDDHHHYCRMAALHRSNNAMAPPLPPRVVATATTVAPPTSLTGTATATPAAAAPAPCPLSSMDMASPREEEDDDASPRWTAPPHLIATVTHPAVTDTTEEQSILDAALQEPADMTMLHRHSSYTTVSDTVSVIVCMVGLPGRGKSFISKRLVRYMNWKGVPCKVFNAGNYRRQLLGVEGTAGAAFFDPNNPQGANLRERMAELACEDLVNFVAGHALAMGILDATNTTRKRRAWLAEYFQQEAQKRSLPYRLLFIESVCTDDTIITENILRSKCDNDDFKNVKDVSAVIAEFRDRIQQYEKVYETLEPEEAMPYIKIINVKHHVILHHVPHGLGSRVAFFLLNLHPIAFPIYIALPGETVGDHKRVYGGEERLTARGEAYAMALKHFIQDRYVPHMVVLHGTNYSVLSTLAPLMNGTAEEEAVGPGLLPAASASSPGRENTRHPYVGEGDSAPGSQPTDPAAPTSAHPEASATMGKAGGASPSSTNPARHHGSTVHPSLDELRAMGGGDLSVVPVSHAAAGDSVPTATVSGPSGKGVSKASTDSVGVVASPSAAEEEGEVSDEEEDEELGDEVLCPVPGLDNINFGRYSGHTAAWVKERYPRLSALLYDVSDDNSGRDSGSHSSGPPATAAAMLGPASMRPSRDPDNLSDAEEAEEERLYPASRWPSPGAAPIPLPPPVHYASHKDAAAHLSHAATGTDPRLSYCIQFPCGESCRQVNVRLEPALMAVMRTQSPVFVVAAAVPAQGVLSFFMDVMPELSPTIRIPSGCVVEIDVKEGISVHPLLQNSLPACMKATPATESSEG